MSSDSVVGGFDVFKGLQTSGLPGSQYEFVYQFTFQCFEKAFRHSIVIAVSFTAHTLYHLLRLQPFSEGLIGIS